jgi:hypothetical protein
LLPPLLLLLLPQYLSLGLPAAAMICLEWWVWELLIFAGEL